MKFTKVPFYQAQKNELIPMTKTAFLYGTMIVVVMLILAFIMSLLREIFPGSQSVIYGTSITGFFTVAYVILNRFYKKNNRMFAREEYKKISRLGALVSMIYFTPMIILLSLNMNISWFEGIVIMLMATLSALLIMWGINCGVLRLAIHMKSNSIKKSTN